MFDSPRPRKGVLMWVRFRCDWCGHKAGSVVDLESYDAVSCISRHVAEKCDAPKPKRPPDGPPKDKMQRPRTKKSVAPRNRRGQFGKEMTDGTSVED